MRTYNLEEQSERKRIRRICKRCGEWYYIDGTGFSEVCLDCNNSPIGKLWRKRLEEQSRQKRIKYIKERKQRLENDSG